MVTVTSARCESLTRSGTIHSQTQSTWRRMDAPTIEAATPRGRTVSVRLNFATGRNALMANTFRAARKAIGEGWQDIIDHNFRGNLVGASDYGGNCEQELIAGAYLVYSVVTDLAIWGTAVYYWWNGAIRKHYSKTQPARGESLRSSCGNFGRATLLANPRPFEN